MIIELVGHKRIVTIDGKWMVFGESVSERYIRRMAPILIRKEGKKIENEKPTTNFGKTYARKR